jgi:ATP/ADP translocase
LTVKIVPILTLLGIPLDSERAVLVGRFFASVNIAACFLQCFIMPSVLSNKTLPRVLSAIPIIIFAVIICGYIYPSLLTIMLGFGALKVLEYSIMTSATEMIYMPMNHQERYLGKELIRFFGHRMGKSVAVCMCKYAVYIYRHIYIYIYRHIYICIYIYL